MADTITIEIPMTAHDRRRVRRMIEAPDGARAYVVAVAPEDVLVIRPRDLAEAARAGHLIGNLHRDIETDGADVVALADAALADRLRRAGLPFVEDRRAFHGRAPGEHAH